MKELPKLTLIAVVAGTVLAGSLLLIYALTGNMAFYLLFNVDYIPVLKSLQPRLVVEIVFHYLFCVASVVVLYYILRVVNLEKRVLIYILVYTGGSGILFYLTIFTSAEPAYTDLMAWVYWTAAHGIYSVIVGMWINKGMVGTKK